MHKNMVLSKKQFLARRNFEFFYGSAGLDKRRFDSKSAGLGSKSAGLGSLVESSRVR